MKDEGVAVNDLYSLMLLNLKLARGDKFHRQTEGRELQAKAVSDVLLKTLEHRRSLRK